MPCAVYTLRTPRSAILHLVVALARESHHSPQPSLRTADYFLFHFQISRIVISVLGETQTQHISLEVVQATVGKPSARVTRHLVRRRLEGASHVFFC